MEGGHETFMPLTQAPLTQAPWTEAPPDATPDNEASTPPGSKRARESPEPQVEVFMQHEEESLAPAHAQESFGPPPPATDEWPTKCPRGNECTDDVIEWPLRYCAPGQTPPDVLGLFAVDIVAVWRDQ